MKTDTEFIVGDTVHLDWEARALGKPEEDIAALELPDCYQEGTCSQCDQIFQIFQEKPGLWIFT